MRVATVVLCLILLAPNPAAAWSAGPLTFEHNVNAWEVAVRGVVTKVDVVDTRAGGWELSRATIDVERTYHGLSPSPKQLAFYFWSSSDNMFTIAHQLAAKDRILVFLSANLDPLKQMKTDPAVKHMLQFAKANHRGYLYRVVADKAGTRIEDAVFTNDKKITMPLATAEALLARRKAAHGAEPAR